MSAAQRLGVRWPNVCGGQAQCGVCIVEVTAGTSSPPLPREQQMLNRTSVKARFGGTLRLACQLVPEEPLTVSKLGVRKPAAA
jgi:2Fe-2S ferredoxin